MSRLLRLVPVLVLVVASACASTPPPKSTTPRSMPAQTSWTGIWQTDGAEWWLYEEKGKVWGDRREYQGGKVSFTGGLVGTIQNGALAGRMVCFSAVRGNRVEPFELRLGASGAASSGHLGQDRRPWSATRIVPEAEIIKPDRLEALWGAAKSAWSGNDLDSVKELLSLGLNRGMLSAYAGPNELCERLAKGEWAHAVILVADGYGLPKTCGTTALTDFAAAHAELARALAARGVVADAVASSSAAPVEVGSAPPKTLGSNWEPVLTGTAPFIGLVHAAGTWCAATQQAVYVAGRDAKGWKKLALKDAFGREATRVVGIGRRHSFCMVGTEKGVFEVGNAGASVQFKATDPLSFFATGDQRLIAATESGGLLVGSVNVLGPACVGLKEPGQLRETGSASDGSLILATDKGWVRHHQERCELLQAQPVERFVTFRGALYGLQGCKVVRSSDGRSWTPVSDLGCHGEAKGFARLVATETILVGISEKGSVETILRVAPLTAGGLPQGVTAFAWDGNTAVGVTPEGALVRTSLAAPARRTYPELKAACEKGEPEACEELALEDRNLEHRACEVGSIASCDRLLLSGNIAPFYFGIESKGLRKHLAAPANAWCKQGYGSACAMVAALKLKPKSSDAAFAKVKEAGCLAQIPDLDACVGLGHDAWKDEAPTPASTRAYGLACRKGSLDGCQLMLNARDVEVALGTANQGCREGSVLACLLPGDPRSGKDLFPGSAEWSKARAEALEQWAAGRTQALVDLMSEASRRPDGAADSVRFALRACRRGDYPACYQGRTQAEKIGAKAEAVEFSNNIPVLLEAACRSGDGPACTLLKGQ